MDTQTIESIAKELIAEPSFTGFVFQCFQLQNALTWCVDFSIEGRTVHVCGDNEPGLTRESVKKEMREKLLATLAEGLRQSDSTEDANRDHAENRRSGRGEVEEVSPKEDAERQP